MPPFLIPAIISGIGSIFQTGYGLSQFAKANKLESNLVRPEYEVNKNIYDNQKIAGQIASEGLSSQAKNTYAENINRTFSQGLDTIMKTGQGINSISNLFSQSNTAFANMLAADAQAKQANQQILLNANKDVATQEQTAWDYNKNLPYQEKVNSINTLRSAAGQNVEGGIQGIASTLLGTLSGGNPIGTLAQGLAAQSGGGGMKTTTPSTTTPTSTFSANPDFLNSLQQFYGNTNAGSNGWQPVQQFIQSIIDNQ